MSELNITVTKELLEREAWRLILLCSQKYFPFKELGKYNLVEVRGIKCRDTTNEPLPITLLGIDKTPIISNKDPMSRPIITKAHIRDIHMMMMTGRYGVLMANGKDAVQEYMGKCMTCEKHACCIIYQHTEEEN